MYVCMYVNATNLYGHFARLGELNMRMWVRAGRFVSRSAYKQASKQASKQAEGMCADMHTCVHDRELHVYITATAKVEIS